MNAFLTRDAAAFGKPVCRLGLASRGDSQLVADDVLAAVERGVNFLNWPADSEGPRGPDGMSRAIAALGPRRDEVVVCIQFASRTANEAHAELESVLATLGTDYVDLVTFYYVEQEVEWRQIRRRGGALDFCRQAQRDGVIRRIGLTSHQRPLAAEMAASGELDALMIRYNAAHRGAEHDVFPVTDVVQVPIVAYTALRWGALLRPTPDDPPGFRVPRAPSWYRFVLQSPSVSVVLAAPHNRAELDEDLSVLAATGPLEAAEYETLAAHGARVRRHAGRFP
jgi:predicted aldo/keto reductase-like oxidoreductase